MYIKRNIHVYIYIYGLVSGPHCAVGSKNMRVTCHTLIRKNLQFQCFLPLRLNTFHTWMRRTRPSWWCRIQWSKPFFVGFCNLSCSASTCECAGPAYQWASMHWLVHVRPASFHNEFVPNQPSRTKTIFFMKPALCLESLLCPNQTNPCTQKKRCSPYIYIFIYIYICNYIYTQNANIYIYI